MQSRYLFRLAKSFSLLFISISISIKSKEKDFASLNKYLDCTIYLEISPNQNFFNILKLQPLIFIFFQQFIATHKIVIYFRPFVYLQWNETQITFMYSDFPIITSTYILNPFTFPDIVSLLDCFLSWFIYWHFAFEVICKYTVVV